MAGGRGCRARPSGRRPRDGLRLPEAHECTGVRPRVTSRRPQGSAPECGDPVDNLGSSRGGRPGGRETRESARNRRGIRSVGGGRPGARHPPGRRPPRSRSSPFTRTRSVSKVESTNTPIAASARGTVTEAMTPTRSNASGPDDAQCPPAGLHPGALGLVALGAHDRELVGGAGHRVQAGAGRRDGPGTRRGRGGTPSSAPARSGVPRRAPVRISRRAGPTGGTSGRGRPRRSGRRPPGCGAGTPPRSTAARGRWARTGRRCPA